MKTSVFESLISASSLPETHARSELSQVIEKYGHNPENITLDELRLILADYLQDVFLSAQQASREVVRDELV
jgi:hypothetical protein